MKAVITSWQAARAKALESLSFRRGEIATILMVATAFGGSALSLFFSMGEAITVYVMGCVAALFALWCLWLARNCWFRLPESVTPDERADPEGRVEAIVRNLLLPSLANQKFFALDDQVVHQRQCVEKLKKKMNGEWESLECARRGGGGLMFGPQDRDWHRARRDYEFALRCLEAEEESLRVKRATREQLQKWVSDNRETMLLYEQAKTWIDRNRLGKQLTSAWNSAPFVHGNQK